MQANASLELGRSASEVLGPASLVQPSKKDEVDFLLTSLVIRVSDFVALLATHSSSLDKEELLCLLDDAREIDVDMERWLQLLPRHWACSRIIDKSWSHEYAYEGRRDIYYDLQIAANWNCYRRTRLTLLMHRSRLLKALDRLYEGRWAEMDNVVMASIQSIAEDVSASIPFHLGTRSEMTAEDDVVFPSMNDEEADAMHRQTAIIHGWFLIVLPLSNLLKIDCLSEDLHAWLESQYIRVCAFVGRKHDIPSERVASIFETAIPAFASALPINSRYIK